MIILLLLTIKQTNMKPVIIKLNLIGTTVHVNAAHILYYYAKQKENNDIVTELFFTEKFGLEVLETPSEIDVLISAHTSML